MPSTLAGKYTDHLFGNFEGNRQHRRQRCRWEVKMNLKGTGFDDMEWIPLPLGRVQWQTLANTNEIPGYVKGGELLDWLSEY
jgi:hypothetical protein